MHKNSLTLTGAQELESPTAPDNLELENLLTALQDILDQWTREAT